VWALANTAWWEWGGYGFFVWLSLGTCAGTIVVEQLLARAARRRARDAVLDMRYEQDGA